MNQNTLHHHMDEFDFQMETMEDWGADPNLLHELLPFSTDPASRPRLTFQPLDGFSTFNSFGEMRQRFGLPGGSELTVEELAETFRQLMDDLRAQNSSDSLIQFTFTTDRDDVSAAYNPVSSPFVRVGEMDFPILLDILRRFAEYRVRDGDDLDWSAFVVISTVVRRPEGLSYGKFHRDLPSAIRSLKSISKIRGNECFFKALYTAITQRSFSSAVMSEYRAWKNELKATVFDGDQFKDEVTCEEIGKVAIHYDIVINMVDFFVPKEQTKNLMMRSQFYVSHQYLPENVTMRTQVCCLLRDGAHLHGITKYTTLLGGDTARFFCGLCCSFVSKTQNSKRKTQSWHCHPCSALSNPMEQLIACNKCPKTHYFTYECRGEVEPVKHLKRREKEIGVLFSEFITPVEDKKKKWKRNQEEEEEVEEVDPPTVIYDYETFTDNENGFKHTPTHVCATFSSIWWERGTESLVTEVYQAYSQNLHPIPQKLMKLCPSEMEIGDRYFYAEGLSCVSQFVEFLAMVTQVGKKVNVFAHNGGNFDNLITFNEMCKYSKPESMLTKGNGLLRVEFSSPNCSLRDSYKLLPFPLSKFQSTFKLDIGKMYYPYKVHTPDTLWGDSKMIVIPPKEDFEPEKLMSDKSKADFDAWYEDAATKRYDLNEVCHEYCLVDTLVLHVGLWTFRKEFREMMNFDPFKKLTIPSLAYESFRRENLQEGLLLDMSKPMIGRFKSTEKTGLSWVKSMISTIGEYTVLLDVPVEEAWKKVFGENEEGFDIEKIHNYRKSYGVTAIVEEITEPNRIYIFFYVDDFENGNPRYYNMSERHPSYELDYTYADAYSDFRYIMKAFNGAATLSGKPIFIKNVWKSDYERSVIVDGVKSTISNKDFQFIIPMRIRDAYMGGRVEPWAYYARNNPGESISKIDVVSLYPSVMFQNDYPVGVPDRFDYRNEPKGLEILYNEDGSEKIYGFIHCDVEVMENVKFPILPHRVDGKLMFPVGRFRGSFTSVELYKAIEHGQVTVENVYEVIQFTDRVSNLFTAYIQKWIAKKMESAGVPEGKSVEEYMREAKMEFGVQMEKDKIESNACRKLLAKLMLNSLYGKFAERNHGESCIIYNHEDLYSLLSRQDIEGVSYIGVGEDYRFCTYQEKRNNSHAPNTNVAVAAFVTAYARMVLWDGVNEIVRNGGELIYGDTDSIAFKHTGTVHSIIKCGNQLGQWEIEHENIQEVIVTAPKSYSCLLEDGKVESHCKGVTLNLKNKGILTHEVYRKLIFGELDDIEVSDFQLVRNGKGFTGPAFPSEYKQKKKVGIVCDKRVPCEFNEDCSFMGSRPRRMEQGYVLSEEDVIMQEEMSNEDEWARMELLLAAM